MYAIVTIVVIPKIHGHSVGLDVFTSDNNISLIL